MRLNCDHTIIYLLPKPLKECRLTCSSSADNDLSFVILVPDNLIVICLHKASLEIVRIVLCCNGTDSIGLPKSEI